MRAILRRLRHVIGLICIGTMLALGWSNGVVGKFVFDETILRLVIFAKGRISYAPHYEESLSSVVDATCVDWSGISIKRYSEHLSSLLGRLRIYDHTISDGTQAPTGLNDHIFVRHIPNGQHIEELNNWLFAVIDPDSGLMTNISYIYGENEIWNYKANRMFLVRLDDDPSAICRNQRATCGLVGAACYDSEGYCRDRDQQGAISGYSIDILAYEPLSKYFNLAIRFAVCIILVLLAAFCGIAAAIIGISGHNSILRMAAGVTAALFAGWIVYHAEIYVRFGSWHDPIDTYLARHLRD